jgi:hypothetical protein
MAQAVDSGVHSTTTAPTTPTPPAYTPITDSERLHNYLMGMVGPMTWVTGAASAGWGLLRDRPEEWGQGARGFGLRMGSGFAQRITRETLTFGASSLLHEDNRYIRSTETTNGARIEYALASTFLARKEDGNRRFSFSRIGGMAGSSLISRAWQPVSTGSMKSAGVNFSISLAFAAGFNVAREFLPKKLRFSK